MYCLNVYVTWFSKTKHWIGLGFFLSLFSGVWFTILCLFEYIVPLSPIFIVVLRLLRPVILFKTYVVSGCYDLGNWILLIIKLIFIYLILAEVFDLPLLFSPCLHIFHLYQYPFDLLMLWRPNNQGRKENTICFRHHAQVVIKYAFRQIISNRRTLHLSLHVIGILIISDETLAISSSELPEQELL